VEQDKSVESAVFVVSDSEYFKMAVQEPHPSQQTKVSGTKQCMSQFY